jgi:hypothetical protein
LGILLKLFSNLFSLLVEQLNDKSRNIKAKKPKNLLLNLSIFSVKNVANKNTAKRCFYFGIIVAKYVKINDICILYSFKMLVNK